MTERHERQRWLRVLACARPDELVDALDRAGLEHPDPVVLRKAEVGTALVTGRVGATGEPFGVGEMTITRCVVQVGEHMGVGYVRGRAAAHARRIAVVDALLQGDTHDLVRDSVIESLARLQAARDQARSADVDTSRVQFVTMVRGN